MATFTYVARAKDGKKQKGTQKADNRQALIQVLQARGLAAENIKEVKEGTKVIRKASFGKKVKTVELLVFTRQLSTIVSAGLPLLQGLDILAEQTEDPNFASIIKNMGENIENGETFSDTLRKFPRAFPDIYTSMVRAGEAGGDLDGVLMQLADYLEASEELKRRIKSAMTYPLVAFSLIIVIASGLILWVVPQFAEIFKSMGDKALPMPTQILITISDTLRSWRALLVLGGAVGVVVAIKAYAKTPIGKFQIDGLKLRLPVFGSLFRKVAISRFARTLSTLTKSGVPIIQALEIVERTAGNEVFAKAIREAGESVMRGETLAEPLARCEQFPAMVTRMIGVGERTGALESMLLKIAEFYDSEVKAAVDGMTSLIEPILIVMMGLIVGFIVIALFMPIMMLSTLVS